MKTRASTIPEIKSGSPGESEKIDLLAEATRAAFRALVPKYRSCIFKKANHGAPITLRKLLQAAHTPLSFQPARIPLWLTPDQQRKLEELILSPEHEAWLGGLLRGFFCDVHKSLNDLLLKLIDPEGPAPKTFQEALDAVQNRFPQDPYLALYLAATRWTCHKAMCAHEELINNTNGGPEVAQAASPAKPSVDQPTSTDQTHSPANFAELHKELQAVSAAVAQLEAMQPIEVATAMTALHRAHTLTASLAEELKSLATEANEPEPKWSSREEFVAQRERIAALASGRTKMFQRATTLVEALAKVFAGVTVRHRLPSRSVALTELAHLAASELTEHAADLKSIVMNHSGSAMEWLNWLWRQEGADAEASQQKLRPISAAFANLLADADWRDFQWPEHLPPTTISPPLPRPEEEIAAAPAAEETAAGPVQAIAQPQPELAPPKQATPVILPAPVPLAEKDARQAEPAPETNATLPAASEPVPDDTPNLKSSEPEPSKPVPSQRTNSPEDKAATAELVTATELAPITPPTESKAPIVAAVWSLASVNRWGLAGHLAALETNASLPPPWVFEAAALAPRVNYEVSAISGRLTEIFAQSAEFRTESLQADARVVTRILLAAVALRPTLLAPTTNAASVLKLSELTAVPRLQALGQFIEAVAEFGLHRQALQPEMLLSSHNLADWEHQLALVRAEIHQWLEQAPSRGFNYALAARIWRKWTTHNGPLRRLMLETAGADTSHITALRANWEPWATHGADFVRTGIREFNHRKTMDGTARDKLIAEIGEAVRLADRVLVLLSQAPHPVATFRTEQVHQLLAARQRSLAPARQELRSLLSASQDAATNAAVRLCDAALSQVEDLLQGHLPLPGGDEPNPRWILDVELLRDPTFQLSSAGTLIPPEPAHLELLLSLARTPADWKDAWTRQVAAENHLGTAALLEFFRWQPPPGLDVAELDQQRGQELEACRHRLEKQAADTHHLLDEFASLGLCREQDYDFWTAEVGNIELALVSAMEFAPLSARLDDVRQKVKHQRDMEAARVRQRLEATEIVQPADRDRIVSLLNSGDIHTAIDYLDLVAKKLPLPQPGTPPLLFLAFFGTGGWLQKAEASLRNAAFSECWQAAATGSVWNALDFQLLGPEQRLAAVSQLQLWQTLERKRQATEADVIEFAVALGLQNPKVTALTKRAGSHTVQPFSVQAQAVGERAAAIVPAFGSDANGRYTLHLVWGEPDAEELLSLCRRDIGDTSGHFVATFRMLNSKERYELAEEARNPDRAFKGVVVDRALFAFACAQPTARFSTILRCGLPFSVVEPYSIAAGEVPPEMFFGRGRELESLADPRGSCFVYGGRQLGKTALLRALERRFHNLQQGRAAIFIDLKRELFSRGRGMNALWSVLVTRLKEAGVLSEIKVGASASQEALSRYVKEWLDTSPDRRLLLLLDEADTFLEEDGKETERHDPFPRCQWLKGLMDATSRRFKVVFAGLHNVQRTTRCVNHPLAHFGEAICIGPMLEEAESRETRALVEQPLAAVGYVFESPDVVSRILALTNYYPSLIQIFCHHLLVDLRANHITRFQNPRLTPPCIITSQHVQTAYSSSVRAAIHIKIGLTLDLDKRYQLIAGLLAFYHANQPADDGVPLRDVRADAAAYWPTGFAEMRTDDEFRCLLEEMIGLGVLRHIPETSKFALRNQNVTTLLGSPEEIIRQLDEAQHWEPALKYEADKFRRLLADDKPKLVFSPLTTQQESELKAPESRVAILYGLPAAGLAQVPAAMASDILFGKSRTTLLHDCSDAAGLSDRIARLERDPQSNTIIIVPAELAWDEGWVAAAHARIKAFKSKDAFLTVLFIADPHRTAATFQGLEGARDLGVRELTLLPWHDAAVRHWLGELGVAADCGVRERICEATGNWPELLMRLNTSDAKGLRHACDDLETLLHQPSKLAELHSTFGFGEEAALQPLRIAAQLGEFTVEEVCEFSEVPDEQGRQRVADCIVRAEKLGLVSITGPKLEFDPVAASILLQSTTLA